MPSRPRLLLLFLTVVRLVVVHAVLLIEAAAYARLGESLSFLSGRSLAILRAISCAFSLVSGSSVVGIFLSGFSHPQITSILPFGFLRQEISVIAGR